MTRTIEFLNKPETFSFDFGPFSSEKYSSSVTPFWHHIQLLNNLLIFNMQENINFLITWAPVLIT